MSHKCDMVNLNWTATLMCANAAAGSPRAPSPRLPSLPHGPGPLPATTAPPHTTHKPACKCHLIRGRPDGAVCLEARVQLEAAKRRKHSLLAQSDLTSRQYLSNECMLHMYRYHKQSLVPHKTIDLITARRKLHQFIALKSCKGYSIVVTT